MDTVNVVFVEDMQQACGSLGFGRSGSLDHPAKLGNWVTHCPK